MASADSAAAAGDGAVGGAAAAAGRMIVVTEKAKRISDYLADSDGEAEGAAAAAAARSLEATPRLRVLPALFTCARLRFVGKGRRGGVGGRKEVVAAAEKGEAASVGCSSGSNAGSGGGGGGGGMGLGLLFLLAKTCVELNKMAEVRAQMEALLEEMRDQLATTKITTADDRHHADGDASRAAPDGDRLLPPPTVSPRPAPVAASSSFAMETELASTSDDADGVSPEDDDAAGAGRHQLNRNSDQEASDQSSSDGEFIELDGGFAAGDLPRPQDTEDEQDSYDDDDEEEQEDDHEVVGGGEGVSALELERRLHELLHRRSRERIRQLESSLRRAARKLVEKEMKVRLWKDTAQLALQPPPPPPPRRRSPPPADRHQPS